MKVLLVVPSRAYKGCPTFPVFPDEVVSLAAVLESSGHEVQVYDNNIGDCRPSELASFHPDIVGFSVFTGPHIISAMDWSIELKEMLPSLKTIWGGIHPSLLPEQTLTEPYIDYVVIGAGEYTLLELVQHLENGPTNLEGIKGLAHKRDGRIIINEPRPFVENLDELPDPAWHLVDVKKYWDITLNTSRGCPYRCTFCANETFHKGYRADLSAERIVSQVQRLKKEYGVSYIKSFGESFVANHERLRELCGLLVSRKLKVKWNCEVRASLAEEDIALMAESGCVSAGLGLETGSQGIMDFVGKGTTVEEMEATFWSLQKHKISTTVYIVYGFPTESAEDFGKTLELLRRLDNPPLLFMNYEPLPGGKMFDYCCSKGLITMPQKLGDWAMLPTITNLSDIPQEMIDKAATEFKKTYATRRLKFTLKHNPGYFWKAVRHPLGFYRELRSLVRLSKSTKKEA